MSARRRWPGGDITYKCHVCHTGHSLERVRRNLYMGQRAIGDVEAFERGGTSRLARRIIRRKVTRALLSELWR